ncbi:MAG TPA: hypothetical protein VNZ61_00280 [Roseomonas sp.]|nr:hypothetical protein [Roseomonas sp.]
MADDAKQRRDKERMPQDAPKLGEVTGMLTGHSTRDAETTRPGDKTTGAGDLGNLLKNQREER